MAASDIFGALSGAFGGLNQYAQMRLQQQELEKKRQEEALDRALRQQQADVYRRAMEAQAEQQQWTRGMGEREEARSALQTLPPNADVPPELAQVLQGSPLTSMLLRSQQTLPSTGISGGMPRPGAAPSAAPPSLDMQAMPAVGSITRRPTATEQTDLDKQARLRQATQGLPPNVAGLMMAGVDPSRAVMPESPAERFERERQLQEMRGEQGLAQVRAQGEIYERRNLPIQWRQSFRAALDDYRALNPPNRMWEYGQGANSPEALEWRRKAEEYAAGIADQQVPGGKPPDFVPGSGFAAMPSHEPTGGGAGAVIRYDAQGNRIQ